MIRGLFKVALSAGLIWFLWDRYQKRFGVIADGPIPQGAKPTGLLTMSMTGSQPGEETVGYGPRPYAEFKLPTGETVWVPIKSPAQEPGERGE